MFRGIELLVALAVIAAGILIYRRLTKSKFFASAFGLDPDEAEVLKAVDDALAVASDCAEELEQEQIQKAVVLKELRRKVRR